MSQKRSAELDGIDLGTTPNPFTEYDEVNLPYSNLPRNTVIAGSEGYGASSLIEHSYRQLVSDGIGSVLIDTEGSITTDAVSDSPTEVIRVGYWDDGETVRGVNLFEQVDEDSGLLEPRINAICSLIQKDAYWGPLMESTIRTLVREMLVADEQYTMEDLLTFLTESDARREFLRDTELDGSVEWVDTVEDADLKPLASRVREIIGTERLQEMFADTTREEIFTEDLVRGDVIVLIRLPITQTAVLKQLVEGFLWMVKSCVHTDARKSGDVDEFIIGISDVGVVGDSTVLPNLFSRARAHYSGMFVGLRTVGDLSSEVQSSVTGNSGNIVAFNPGDVQTSNILSEAVDSASRKEILSLDSDSAFAHIHAAYGVADVELDRMT